MHGQSVTRREFISFMAAGSAALALGSDMPVFAAGRKPNIIVILADDLGYADLGCQGAKDLLTPNIDSIAANGVRFTNGYVSAPMCSPCRAGFITGRYQQRFGHEFNPGPTGMDANFGLPVTETTFPQRLQAAGYVTGTLGKWHLGKTPDRAQTKRGFTEHMQMEFTGKGEDMQLAADFIDRHKDEPFFLYVASGIPHHPLEPKPESVERFAHIKDEMRRKLAAWMYELDEMTGEILKAVRKNDLEENTLIFFLSDNGAPRDANGSLNTPFTGYKMEMGEGGIRVPYMVQWKGKIPAGKVYDKPVISLDIAATALAAAGVKVEPGKLDGVNMVPFLKSNKGNPHENLYWRVGKRHAIRSGNWKLVNTEKGGPFLYDLATDPSETRNLASENPDKVKELASLYAKWDAQLAKPLWQERFGGD